MTKSRSGRSINMLKKEQRKIKNVVCDEYLTAEEKQRRINQILYGGSSCSFLFLFLLLLCF
jgi:F0F1-type ATP synthase delta subunit